MFCLNMIKVLQVSIVTVLTSLFFFPFFFSFLPSINTKMFLAVLGLLAYCWDHIKGRTDLFERSLFKISVWALGVSFCSFLSMTINNTPDNSYLGYIMSMLVWLFAAYFCVSLMRTVHGYVSAEIVGYYLMSVALLQCTIGLLINHFPVLENLVETYITGEKYMGVGIGKARLHGIGCALDVGGGRLGAILIIIAYLILQAIEQQKSKWWFIGLLSAFLYVFVIGNMMGRTASVGGAIALAYLFFSFFYNNKKQMASFMPFLSMSLIIIGIFAIVCIGLYHASPESRRLLRFGFEAFFNYFENGRFETNSTNMLSEGMIFPDNLKTWIVGDGYMAGTANDPYYIGPSDYGFYKNTDAGYSRFIFYFGLVGLSILILFFINVCKECINRTERMKFCFIAILILGLCIWVKVSTDIFLVFTPFLCFNDEYQDNESKVCENIE